MTFDAREPGTAPSAAVPTPRPKQRGPSARRRDDAALRPARRQSDATAALGRLQALLMLSLQCRTLQVGGRGRFHSARVREQILALVATATAQGARQRDACRIIGISARTLQRWRKPSQARDRRIARSSAPKNALTAAERERIEHILRADEYAHLPPRQLVAKLADEGCYLASESTFYRLRRARTRSASRSGQPPRAQRACAERVLEAPNQVWSWDITYLPAPMRGRHYYLYMFMDLFSRRIMGWQVYTCESMSLAAYLVQRTCATHAVDARGLILHSDNGGPMRGATMLATLRRLGVVSSFSRPWMKNDNPFVESLFRTLKRRPSYPTGPFLSLLNARAWIARFVRWYNREHLHSGIGFVTPDERYHGRDAARLAQRQRLYEAAHAAQPARWSRAPRQWTRVPPVRFRAATRGAGGLHTSFSIYTDHATTPLTPTVGF
ncbi:IS3 family transposase [Haliangium ochraceum]|uniref:Integrase catalytic region n=1 Tax=Haliangium ochraceum (strain DSM 14365 / JCM 11303 / SMP-2) TaxID=502025 RepID=D0LME4_HALO1|nr:IS3 family transposase [Haliangium ochraceum]ACY16850.1 Integrase catalytic region [Haliangium ochraceum DSM 14365]